MATKPKPAATRPTTKPVPAVERSAAPRVTVRTANPIHREVRGAYSIWQRELIRFFRERVRAVTSFVQPLLYLLVFGSGLATTIRAGATGTNNFKIFLLPGVIAMTTLFTSMFAAVSITWDREFGFLKEILVAPVSRTSVVLAKAFGGATTSAMQGLAVLVFAPVVGMHLSALRILAVAPMLVVMALAVNALGLVMASRVATMQGFMVIMNFITLPLYFLSGALFPLTTAPAWLRTIGYFDPVSYAVDAIRRTLIPAYPAFLHLHVRSWVPPVPVEIAILAAFASLMFVLAVRGFERQP